MLRSALAVILALLAAPAAAQQFPTIKDNSVIGRLGTGSGSGPSQAIPFATLFSKFSGAILPVVDGDLVCFNGTAGQIKDCTSTLPSGLTLPNPIFTGTVSFSTLKVNPNASAVPAIPTTFQNSFTVGALDTATRATMSLVAPNNGESTYLCFSAGNTYASPTATAAGTRTCEFFTHPWTTTAAVGFLVSAGSGLTMDMVETNPATTAAAGQNLKVWTTPIGTGVVALNTEFHANGGQVVGAPTGGSKGAGTVNATGLYVNGVAVGTAALTTANNVLGADVNLNNTANYFDGPSMAQGTSGTWWVAGNVTIKDTAGAANIACKLWDGTTIIASSDSGVVASGEVSVTLVGFLASPAANIRISCRDATSTSGKIVANDSGSLKDSTISGIRIN